MPPRSSATISSAPPAMEVYYSRPLAATVMVLTVVFAVHMGYALWALSQSFLVWPLPVLVAVPIIGMCLVAWRPSWRAWHWEGAVIVLDDEGVIDHRRAIEFAPWKDIGEVFLSRPRGQTLLCLEFNDDATAKKYARNPFLFNSVVRYLGFWGHWNSGLGLLRCRPIEVLDAAIALRRHSIRVRVREANERYAAANAAKTAVKTP